MARYPKAKAKVDEMKPKKQSLADKARATFAGLKPKTPEQLESERNEIGQRVKAEFNEMAAKRKAAVPAPKKKAAKAAASPAQRLSSALKIAGRGAVDAPKKPAPRKIMDPDMADFEEIAPTKGRAGFDPIKAGAWDDKPPTGKPMVSLDEPEVVIAEPKAPKPKATKPKGRWSMKTRGKAGGAR